MVCEPGRCGVKFRRRKLIEVIVIAAVIASGAPLQAQDAQERERFELFTECRPVGLVVVLGDDNGEGLPEPLTELTEERVRTLAESRLRAARLFSSEPVFPLLAISVEVVGQMSVRKVGLSKLVHDPLSGETHFASTWDFSVLGTHAGGAAFIMQGLSELVDTFVLEYLRVNEESCNN